MKRILFAILALAAMARTQAKVVRILYADGTEQIITSSELGAIDFNSDGTLSITAYDGTPIAAHDAMFANIRINDDAAITAYIPRTMVTRYVTFTTDIELFHRDATYINFVYPSHDPMGNPVTLSGAIIVPDNIMSGADEAEGIILSQHFTVSNKDEIPSRGYNTIEAYFMANPLRPNYIMVCSDFYGFGATERFPQAFVYGTANGVASLDALIAARQLLEDEGIPFGDLLFNVGYSSGAFDAMATLQAAQTLPGYEDIHFDKTFCGGGPYDLRTMYRDYVERDSVFYLVAMPLTLISMNENGHLGLDYGSIFTPLVSDHIDDWFLSKNYSTWPLCDSIGRDHRISDMLQPDYQDLSSSRSRTLQGILREQSMNHTGWTPDTNERIFLFHSRDDDYIPIECSRNMADYLTARGYTKSILPGRTNLQTNFLVKGTGHLASTPIYIIQAVSAMKAWPLMYHDGQLNPIYDWAINGSIDIVGFMRQLDAIGFDTRNFIRQLLIAYGGMEDTGDGSIDYLALMQMIEGAGIDFAELVQTFDDCGINIMDLLIELLSYFNEQSDETDEAQPIAAEAALDRRIAHMLDAAADPTARPDQRYAAQLRRWFDEATSSTKFSEE